VLCDKRAVQCAKSAGATGQQPTGVRQGSDAHPRPSASHGGAANGEDEEARWNTHSARAKRGRTGIRFRAEGNPRRHEGRHPLDVLAGFFFSFVVLGFVTVGNLLLDKVDVSAFPSIDQILAAHHHVNGAAHEVKVQDAHIARLGT